MDNDKLWFVCLFSVAHFRLLLPCSTEVSFIVFVILSAGTKKYIFYFLQNVAKTRGEYYLKCKQN